MRKMKKLIGVATAVATVQSSLFSGVGMVMAADATGDVTSGNVTTDTALTGVENLLVDPDAAPVVTPEAIVEPGIIFAELDIAEDGMAFTFTNEGITVTTGSAVATDAAVGYEIDGTELTISEPGNYYISGECTDGSIKVKKKTEDVKLVLNGLNLTSQTTAPLVMAGDTEVDLVVYGENTLSDTEMNNDETHADNEDAENAVVKAKSDSSLTISGGGKLTIDGNAKNALKSNGTLTIEDAILDIDAVDDGISNEDHVVINGGYIDIKAEGDGIKSSADDTPTGSVTINDGIVIIDAMKDGIQATMEVVVNGGIVDITTYGGSEAEYDSDDDSYPSAKGLKASGSYEVEDEETGEVEEVDATGSALTVNGGTIYLDCADDAMKSDGDVNIFGGYMNISTGCDGIQAEYINTIGKKGGNDDDLYIYISKSEEAIEGAKVFLNAGTTRAFAWDDGVNAANSDLVNYNYEIEVNGGNHYVSCSEGDGLDSNGSLLITGGTIVVLGSSGAGEGDPLDCETTFNITGGTVLAMGTYSPMGRTPQTTNYVQFGAAGGMGGNMNQPGGNMGTRPEMPEGEMPQMPGASGDAVMVPGGDMGQMMPGVSSDAVRPEMPEGGVPQMPGVSGDAVGMPGGNMGTRPEMPEGEMPQMPGASGDAVIPDGNMGNIPGGTMANISVKDGNTVVVADTSGQAITAAVAKWLPDASSYSAGYVFCWSEEIAQDKDYDLYVNGEVVASTKEETQIPNNPQQPEQPENPQETILAGDVNGDGNITLEDAQMVLKAALRIINLADNRYGDMDNNNNITLEDAQKVLKKALRIVE